VNTIMCLGCAQTITKTERCPYCTSGVQVQLLGSSHKADECIQALLAILIGFNKCSAITALFGPRDTTYNSRFVCFAVWNWCGADITIIRDGFSTLGGDDRVDLGHAFHLIALYQIPLFQKQVDEHLFRRVVRGRITDEDLQELRIHEAVGNNLGRSYPYTLSHDKQHLWLYFQHPPIPYWMIEPEFYEEVRDLPDHPADTVFKVVRRLEMIIRDVCQLPALVTGELLIQSALGEKKPLELRAETGLEVDAWFCLFRGVIGALKEPHNRSEQKITEEEALEQIMTVNMLLRKLKYDYPKKFPTKDERV
jgi:hypothetical protein